MIITASDTHTYISALPKSGVLRALDSKERSAAAAQSSDPAEKSLSADNRYPVSKLCEVLLVQEIARHISPRVIICTTNPGLCHSSLTRGAEGARRYILTVLKCVVQI